MLLLYFHFAIAYPLEDFRARRVCGTALVQGIRFKCFFPLKTFLDFLYLAVTHPSIFKSCAVFWLALRPCQNTNKEWKYWAILHTKQFNNLFIIQLLFFSCQVFLLISHKVGKVRRIKKRSVRSQPPNCLLYKITNGTHMGYIFTLFETTLCSWIIRPNYLVVPLTVTAPKFPYQLNPFIHTLLIRCNNPLLTRGQKQPI